MNRWPATNARLRGIAALLAVALLTSCSSADGAAQTDSTSTASMDDRIADVLAEHVPDTAGRFVAAALVVRVADGDAIAWGASDGSGSELADVQRPSGSTLKLVIDAAAARAGVTAEDGVIVGTGCSFPDGVSTRPDDATPILSLRHATAISSNCAFAKLARAIGGNRLRSTLADLGVTRELDVGTRLGLGANTVSMSELATIGRSLMRDLSAEDPERAEAARRVVTMTADVLTTGTAGGKSLTDRWAMAKTGTSARSADAWIVGATPQYVTVVWMGNPAEPDDGMIAGAVPGYESVQGGGLPALVWRDVMEAVHRGLSADPSPDAVAGDRDVVIVVDPSVDCLGLPELVRSGPPGPDVSHIETGGPIRC